MRRDAPIGGPVDRPAQHGADVLEKAYFFRGDENKDDRHSTQSGAEAQRKYKTEESKEVAPRKTSRASPPPGLGVCIHVD